MAESRLAPGKKRYTVSLNQANVERFQCLVREFGLPQNTMSNALNDSLTGLCALLQDAKERGSMNLSDIFRLMGKQLELLEMDEKEKKKC